MDADHKYLFSDNLIRMTEDTLHIDGFLLGSKTAVKLCQRNDGNNRPYLVA
jgi:hypothetical protein